MTYCTKVSLILVVVLVQLCKGANGDCRKAVANSVAKVASCPTSIEERNNAAMIKNCSKMSYQQNCSDDLVFHCVINGFRNETLEVCATKKLIDGFCTEFNVAGGVIQSHPFAPCNQTNFPICDTHYFSSDAYKYPGCYELVYNNGKNQTIEEESNNQRNTTIDELKNRGNTTHDQPENRDKSIVIVAAILGTLAILIVLVVIGVFIYKRRKKYREKGIPKTKGEIEKLITDTHELEEGSPWKTEENVGDENSGLIKNTGESTIDQFKEKKIPKGIATRAETSKDTTGSPWKTEENVGDENSGLIKNTGENTIDQFKEKKIPTGIATRAETSKDTTERKPKKAKDVDATTGTDRYTYKTEEDDREENFAESIRFLKSYKKMDQFFVETDSYKKAESIFIKNGIVALIGPPGCGKTVAAIHLIRKELRDWTFRKICSWEEFSYIAEDTNSLVFIDNIFFRRTIDSDLENWWDKLNKIHENYFTSDDVEMRMKHLRIVMTARSNVIEKACTYMGKVTPILNEKFLMDASKLADNEKDAILDNQILFARGENREHIPIINNKFKEEVKLAAGPIGFPLCAHLYVFNEEYQNTGASFFSRPTEFLKLQIKDEIENDKTNRTKSLFFFMFFFEWHTKMGKIEKLNLKSESSCRTFVNKISPDFVKNFAPFDFNGLDEKAQKLSGAFFKEVGEIGEQMYKFVHESVNDAVGAYFCEAYFTETAKYFPLDMIQYQVYENLNKSQKVTLATRLLYEALNQQLSQVFGCKIFRKEEFSTFFYSELQKKDNNTVDLFLTVTNESSVVKLPTIFWTSCNNLFPLTEKLYECVKGRNISPEYQLYALLFGMCCARSEGTLKTVNGMFRDNIDMLKNRVLSFKDYEGNYIPHMIIVSKSSDEFASKALKEIFEEKKTIAMERNKHNMTLLMLAVKQNLQRAKVIEHLLKISSNNLLFKDTSGSTLLHHLLGSENDDETCAQYLDKILSYKKAKKCLPKDDIKGDTALSIAAKETKHSRILSMLKLLECGECIVETLNEGGCSPLHLCASSMKRDTPFHKVECCSRVIILLLYGASPNKQTDKSDEPVDECKYEGVRTILENPSDEKTMENILDGYLKDIGNLKNCNEIPEHDLKLSNKLSQGIKKRILKAAQYLKNIEFETSA